MNVILQTLGFLFVCFLTLIPYNLHPILLLQICTTYAGREKSNRHFSWAPGLLSKKVYKEEQNLKPPDSFLPVFNAKQRAQAGHHRKGTEQNNIKRSREILHGDVN